jgi:UrcA family protein
MNTVTNLRLITATLIASIATSFAFAAHAGEAAAPQLVVKYDDLNLATERGALELYRRISAAAVSVCPSLDGRDLTSRKLMRNCVHAAIADAVVKVDLPELSSIYRNKNQALPV